MRIHDLVEFVDFSVVLDVCRTKLNSTYVKHKDKWYICEVADSNEDGETGEYLEYGCGTDWLWLGNGDCNLVYLNTLKDVITEPEWPDAGWYWFNDLAYKLSYSNKQIYKAGLSRYQIFVTRNGSNCSTRRTLELLNGIEQGLSYPAAIDAEDLLLLSPNNYVPINARVVIGAHPYVDGPVAFYNDASIGTVEGGVIKLSASNNQLIEYLDHAGVKYA